MDTQRSSGECNKRISLICFVQFSKFPKSWILHKPGGSRPKLFKNIQDHIQDFLGGKGFKFIIIAFLESHKGFFLAFKAPNRPWIRLFYITRWKNLVITIYCFREWPLSLLIKAKNRYHN